MAQPEVGCAFQTTTRKEIRLVRVGMVAVGQPAGWRISFSTELLGFPFGGDGGITTAPLLSSNYGGNAKWIVAVISVPHVLLGS